MASILSRKAKLQVVDFLNGHHIDRLAKDWQGIYRTYHSESPARRQVLPLPEYVLSREFDACCDAYLSEESLSYLFSDGPPAVLWYALPKRIISSVVQHFTTCPPPLVMRDIVLLNDEATTCASAVWPELFAAYLPCTTCQREEPLDVASYGLPREARYVDDAVPERFRRLEVRRTQDEMRYRRGLTNLCIIQSVHIRHPSRSAVLTVELWFDKFILRPCMLDRLRAFPADGRPTRGWLKKAVIFLRGSCPCLLKSAIPSSSCHKRTFLPNEIIADVLRFLDRLYIDVGMLVCRKWHDHIDRSPASLPVHILRAQFDHSEPRLDQSGQLCHSAEWSFRVENHSKCFGFIDVRSFTFTNDWTSPDESALIYRHLRNAFVKEMYCATASSDVRWTLEMLLGLHANCTVHDLHAVFTTDAYVRLIRQFDAAMLRRQVTKLDVRIHETHLKALVEDRGYFSLSSIARLTRLRLTILETSPTMEPYWVRALYELPNCCELGVHYKRVVAEERPDVSGIISSLRTVVEEFERSGRPIVVDSFSVRLSVVVDPPTHRKNMLQEAVRVQNLSILPHDLWDIYHYENPDKTDVLSVLVFHTNVNRRLMEVHIRKGRVEPQTLSNT